MILNPDHVTIAVADAGPAIEFFALLGFKKDHVATIDGGLPARYMGMPGMKAQHITLALEGAAYPFEIQLLEFEPIPGTDPGAHGQRRNHVERRNGLHQPKTTALRGSRGHHP
jgi:catechol 2,3-dioxygenase-like lactoylglutathione lyase family enzyme